MCKKLLVVIAVLFLHSSVFANICTVYDKYPYSSATFDSAAGKDYNVGMIEFDGTTASLIKWGADDRTVEELPFTRNNMVIKIQYSGSYIYLIKDLKTPGRYKYDFMRIEAGRNDYAICDF